MTKLQGGLTGFAHGSLDGSLFDATEWNLYDWEMLLADHPTLVSKASAASRDGIDARDAFFALCDRQVVGDGPSADAWRAMIQTPAWKAAINGAKTELDRFVFISGMLDSMMSRDSDDGSSPDDGGSDGSQDPGDLGLLDALQALVDAMGIYPEDAIDEDGQGEPVAVASVPSKQDAEEAKALVELVGTLGSFSDRTGDEERLQDALAIASMLDLRDFSLMLGFVSRVVRGASRKAEHASGELTGYRNDTWSDKVVPHDMLAVAEGDMHAMIRLSESQLTVRDFKGERSMGKGPCILLRDETESMTIHGSHKQALCLEIALAQAMNKDGRDLVSVAWGDVRTRTYIWGDSGILHANAGRDAEQRVDGGGLHEHLTAFLDGHSTKLWNPLMEGCRVANEYVDGADILVISDGYVSDAMELKTDPSLTEALDSFRDAGGRLWGVVVGDLDASRWSEKLPVMDGVISAKDLREGDALAEMLASMANRESEGGPRKRILA